VTRLIVAASIAASLVLLSGCVSNDPLAVDANNENFTSADGSVTEVAPANRGEAVSFESSDTTDGSTLRSEDFRGSVLVVNFWYAACPPCRAEAPDLAELATTYANKGVLFLGVNVFDNASGAQSFETSFDIPYPSILDADTGELRLAFASDLPPSGIPTTFIVDRDGRVAARVLGFLSDRSMFEDMLDRVVAEASP
jgi:thiol-disulfide isomerase/thioredoxin